MALRFYVRDWLSASAGVGLLKALSHTGQDPDSIIEGTSLVFEEEDVKDRFPLALARKLTEDLKPETIGDKSLVDVAFARLLSLNDFYSNSPLSNPSSVKKKVMERSKEFEELFSFDPVGAVRQLIGTFVSDVFAELLGRELSDRTCFFCGERKAYLYKGKPKTFEAVNFTPLSASTSTVENFFYNGKNNLYLCAHCEIVFYFAGFGFTKVARDKYLFVYVPDLKETVTLNSLLEDHKGINRGWLGKAVAEILKETERRKAEWILENIYVVEIEKVSESTSNIYSFSIQPRVARAIDAYLDKYPKPLNPLFSQFLEHLYSGRSLYTLLLEVFYGYFYEEGLRRSGRGKVSDALRVGMNLARNSKYLPYSLLFLSKFQEVVDMKDKSQVEKQVNWAYSEGLKLKESLYRELGEKASDRIRSVSYSILEAIRRRDIDAFQQNLIRVYLSVEREIPYLFVEALKDGSFNRIAYAFLVGLNGRGKGEEYGTEAHDPLG